MRGLPRRIQAHDLWLSAGRGGEGVAMTLPKSLAAHLRVDPSLEALLREEPLDAIVSALLLHRPEASDRVAAHSRTCGATLVIQAVRCGATSARIAMSALPSLVDCPDVEWLTLDGGLGPA